MKKNKPALFVGFFLIGLLFARISYAQTSRLPDRFQLAQKLSPQDMQKAKDLMKGYFKKNSGSNNSSTDRSGSNLSVPTLIEKPSGFVPTPSQNNLDPSKLSTRDQMFIKVHMKLANKHFKKKDSARSIFELEQIFERAPTLASARFMRAVIAAREKDYPSAWRNIEIAIRGNPDDSKMQTFVERLKGVFPRPKNLPQIDGIYRKRPVCATQLAVDALERLFQEEQIAKINKVSFDGFKEEGGRVTGNLQVTGLKALPKDDLIKSLTTILGGQVTSKEGQDGGTSLQIEVEIPGLPLANPSIKPISGIPEFMKMISEETDVPIQESTETTPDSAGRVTGTYSIVARDLQYLNDFLRKIAPYASKYEISTLYPEFLSSRVVIKGEIQIVFHPQQTN